MRQIFSYDSDEDRLSFRSASGSTPKVTGSTSKASRKRDLFGAVESTLGEEMIPSNKEKFYMLPKFKYDCNSKETVKKLILSKELLDEQTDSLSKSFEKLILHSKTNSTWSRHESAKNCYKNFCDTYKIVQLWPASVNRIRSFVTWAVTEKKLRVSTVKSYVYSIAMWQEMQDISCPDYLLDKTVRTLLKGSEVIEKLEGNVSAKRMPMSISLLNILSDRIAKSQWNEISKQVVYTACVVCFFTSCRMGELLANAEWSFDPKTTLKWENVRFLENNEVTVFIPFTKTAGFDGFLLDIFPVENSQLCPILALKKLARDLERKGCLRQKNPVFQFSTGKNLTTAKLNEILKKLLHDFTNDELRISCHSFRAGIPSAIAGFPDKAKVSDVMQWGNWNSESYKRYIKQDREKRRVLFEKIVSLL
jgi:hypothetical protein